MQAAGREDGPGGVVRAQAGGGAVQDDRCGVRGDRRVGVPHLPARLPRQPVEIIAQRSTIQLERRSDREHPFPVSSPERDGVGLDRAARVDPQARPGGNGVGPVIARQRGDPLANAHAQRVVRESDFKLRAHVMHAPQGCADFDRGSRPFRADGRRGGGARGPRPCVDVYPAAPQLEDAGRDQTQLRAGVESDGGAGVQPQRRATVGTRRQARAGHEEVTRFRGPAVAQQHPALRPHDGGGPCPGDADPVPHPEAVPDGDRDRGGRERCGDQDDDAAAVPQHRLAPAGVHVVPDARHALLRHGRARPGQPDEPGDRVTGALDAIRFLGRLRRVTHASSTRTPIGSG